MNWVDNEPRADGVDRAGLERAAGRLGSVDESTVGFVAPASTSRIRPVWILGDALIELYLTPGFNQKVEGKRVEWLDAPPLVAKVDGDQLSLSIGKHVIVTGKSKQGDQDAASRFAAEYWKRWRAERGISVTIP